MGRAAIAARIAALLASFTMLAAGCGGDNDPTPTPPSSPTAQPNPTATVDATPTPTSAPTPPPATDGPPERDLLDLARRFLGQATGPSDRTPFDYRIGDREEFTVIDVSAPSLRRLNAGVRLITDHAYFFVEEGTDASSATLEAIGRDFEQLVYPTITAAFGRERSPGVDADPRISIVYADLQGAGGYVTSADAFPRSAVPRSNEREAIYIDAAFLNSAPSAYNAVLAHELQHLVHDAADSGEEAWVNEGLSQVAAELVGGGTDQVTPFLGQPDTQLNTWIQGGGPHYGESQLFFRYVLDRFGGRDNARALVRVPQDGLAGVDAFLRSFDSSAVDVFADWAVANYLDAESGPYTHRGLDAGVAAVTAIGDEGEGDDTVNQFAADYLEIDPPADGTVFTFDGADTVTVGIEPNDGSGYPFWWSAAGDGIDSRLTHEFDLRDVQSATLRFRVWFDTELGWDYGYVAVSSDGGDTWQALPGRHTSNFDPVGQAYGPGYTGSSDGRWLQEEIDLTPFAGNEVLVRFEYVSDDSVHGRGLAVDDIRIAQLDFTDPAEDGAGWQAEGFRRVEGPLEQRFVLRLLDRDATPFVAPMSLGEGNRVEITLTDSPVTIVVAAATEGTTEPASYRWSLRR